MAEDTINKKQEITETPVVSGTRNDGAPSGQSVSVAPEVPQRNAVIVDDDPSIRSLVEAVLVAEGYCVTPFPDGNSACAALEKGTVAPPHVLVLDMMMPGLHGLDVLTRLKLKPQLAKIPVIMLTAESRPQDLMSGYEHGADYYITKPFTRQQLVFGLELVLKQSKKQS